MPDPTSPLFGLYRGRVISAGDPQGQRRLQVEVSSVLGTNALWALPCVPPGSRKQPATGATVWVMFENGDPSSPVWLGTLPEIRSG